MRIKQVNPQGGEKDKGGKRGKKQNSDMVYCGILYPMGWLIAI